MAGETILIVDDNPDVCILLGERVLPSYGYRTLTATDGQEGLWQIRTQRPDLILLDLRLPDMTGLDLLHILSSEGYDTPVILITAYGSELIAAQALRLGVRDYIIKPFTLDEIVESVERALIEQRLRRERNALTDYLHNCTKSLRALVDTSADIVHIDDYELNLCRLVEVALASVCAQRAQIWFYDSGQSALYLRVAQDSSDQRAYLVHRREPTLPQVELALSTGEIQQWVEGQESLCQTVIALPILQERRPGAVLVLYIPDQESSASELSLLVLQLIGRWIEMVLEQSRLIQKNHSLQGQIEAAGDLSQEVLFVLDEEHCIVAVTPAVQTLLGQTPEEVIGQDFRQWIQTVGSSPGELVEWYLEQSTNEQSTERYTFLFQDAQGEPRQAEVRVLPQRLEGGGLRRYLLFQEVTAYSRLEQSTRSLRQTLNQALRGSLFGLFLTDLNGQIQAVNGALVDMLQLTPEEVWGKSLWEVLAPAEGSQLLPEEITRAYREGTSYTEIRWPDMEMDVWGITTWQLISEGETPSAIVVLVRPAFSPPAEPGMGSPADESDLLGGSWVHSRSRI